VLSKRLASYRSLTEPLIHYYSERRKLLTVDGMMTIEHVTREINRILAAIGAVDTGAAKGGPLAKRARAPARKAPRPVVKRAKAATNARKAGKPASKAVRKPTGKAAAGSRARPAKKLGKPAKKVTKKRSKT
jgi:adenylate kinase